MSAVRYLPLDVPVMGTAPTVVIPRVYYMIKARTAKGKLSFYIIPLTMCPSLYSLLTLLIFNGLIKLGLD